MYKLVISLEYALHCELGVKLKYHNGKNERGVETGPVAHAHTLFVNLYVHVMCSRLFIVAVSSYVPTLNVNKGMFT